MGLLNQRREGVGDIGDYDSDNDGFLDLDAGGLGNDISGEEGIVKIVSGHTSAGGLYNPAFGALEIPD